MMPFLWVSLHACGADVDALLSGLASENPTVRQDAIVEAAVDDPRVLAALGALCNDPDARIRADAVTALDALRTEAALPALLQRIHDQDPTVARKAIDALGHLGHPSAVAPLVQLVSSPDPPRNAIWALGQTHSPEAVAPLAALRAHSDPTIRYLADEALRQIE